MDNIIWVDIGIIKWDEEMNDQKKIKEVDKRRFG